MRKSESLKSVFEGLPEIPPQFQASGQVSTLVSYHEGEVRGELHQNPQILSTLKGLRRFSIAAIFFCISVFPFFVRVHIFRLIIIQVTKLSRWNRPISTKSASCHPWSSWKKTFMLVNVWRRPLMSLASLVCVSWCIQILWSCPMI